MVKRGQREIILATKASNLLKFAILLWIRNGKRVNTLLKNNAIVVKFKRGSTFSRSNIYFEYEKLKKAYIQSAIEFKKSRK